MFKHFIECGKELFPIKRLYEIIHGGLAKSAQNVIRLYIRGYKNNMHLSLGLPFIKEGKNFVLTQVNIEKYQVGLSLMYEVQTVSYRGSVPQKINRLGIIFQVGRKYANGRGIIFYGNSFHNLCGF